MISRRALALRLPLIAAAGVSVWLVRDRIPWPPPSVRFARGRTTGWISVGPDADLIELDGQANGTPIRIIVDSGAQFSAIDRALAESLGLRQTAMPMLAYGVSGKPDMAYTVKLDLRLPGLHIEGLRAVALDLARLADAAGRRFSMILGRDMLKALVLEADLPRGHIALRAPSHGPVARDATVVPLKIVHAGEPTLPVAVDGVPLDVLIDTGSTGVLALSTAAARRAGLLAPERAAGAAPSISVGGAGVNRIAHARTVQAAGVTLHNPRVEIYEPSRAGHVPTGLLGMGFLRRYRLTLDLPARRLVLRVPSLLLVPPP